ncbi:MAG: CDP-alcohol phosphatidyltransferase family protein [Desulfobulbaceae bacterium]|nr:CDP-alcohol phosphatidyltransferase family protein [Desulfobulbaceae bacterium]
MTGKNFTFSNFLSVLRILLIPPFLYYLHGGQGTVAFVIMLVAISTDWFDGQVARRTNTVSDTGKILDPLADKLCALSTAGYFLWTGQLPLWFVLFVLLRDLAIFVGGMYAKSRYKVLTTSLMTGKWAVGFMAMMFVVMVWPNPPFDAEQVKELLLYIATVMLAISFAEYVVRFVRIVQGKPFHNR